MGNVLASDARHPARLRGLYRLWRKAPRLAQNAAPSLFFAVIGVAILAVVIPGVSVFPVILLYILAGLMLAGQLKGRVFSRRVWPLIMVETASCAPSSDMNCSGWIRLTVMRCAPTP